MTPFDVDDTIVAIASPPGPGFRGIVRLSGPQTLSCLDSLFEARDRQPISNYQTSTAIEGEFRLPNGLTLPGELLLWPTCQSYTRQPTAEFHTIGSTPVLQWVLQAICEHGARLAQPGEFTLRAFLSGRIDLTQAEAVLAVIDADNEHQLSTALRQLAGGLAGPLGEIREQLLSLLAELEAGLDFVEEDIEFISESDLRDQLLEAKQHLTKTAKQIIRRDLAVDTVKVVLFGLPNSGKSSLFNALTRSEQAIVTEIAGTTTDFISARLSVDTGAIELIDTAGFETLPVRVDNQVSQQAQSQRVNQQAQAAVRLLCIDSSRQPADWEADQLAQAAPTTIVVLTKSDLSEMPAASRDGNGPIEQKEALLSGFRGPVVVTSIFDAASLERLCDQISDAILQSQHSDQTVVQTTVRRATESLLEAQRSVGRALEAAEYQLGEELIAAEVRQSLDALGQVVGTVYTDDILDLVFGRFCIGK